MVNKIILTPVGTAGINYICILLGIKIFVHIDTYSKQLNLMYTSLSSLSLIISFLLSLSKNREKKKTHICIHFIWWLYIFVQILW
jgi:hypothetical protein